MENCIFCKIIKGEIPCAKVHEDDNFLAFLDINPVADGHMMIIPKEHVVWMQDASDEIIAEIFKLTKKMMLAMKNGIGCDYVQVSVVGKDVPHFHVHLIPRYFNDGMPQFSTKKYKDGESAIVVQKITQAL